MHNPQFYPGALLVDSKGTKYLVLSCDRDGHQYERYWAYTVLSEGRVVVIDDFHYILKELNLVDTLTGYG